MKARHFLIAAAVFSFFSLCVASANAQQQKRRPGVAIGQSGAEALLMAKVEPDYPEAVKNKEIAGQIVITFTIGQDGSVSDARQVAVGIFGCKSLNSEDPELQQAAIAAVKQWRFVAFRLHDIPGDQGTPVEVETSVALPFDFRKPGAAPSSALADMAPCNMPKDAPPSKFAAVRDPTRAEFGRPVIPPERAEGQLTHRVEAQYPQMLEGARLQGNAVLHVLIDKLGHVVDIKKESGHPLLIQAAMDAVKQWQYRPFQLNGAPAEAETPVVIKFRCDDAGKSCTRESGSACRCAALPWSSLEE
ncbi:MAG TPA: energy transducer TonB [Candidatus Angelobacter sp.]|nr:energy transducer TonB [Candidatus Angelobacter sp.]